MKKEYNWWTDPKNAEAVEKLSWWEIPKNKTTVELPVSIIETECVCKKRMVTVSSLEKGTAD